MTSPMFKRSPQAIFSQVGSDIVALNVDRGAYYGMEHVTARVWELLSTPRTIDQLCQELMAIYEIDAATCEADINALLRDMESEGLIERTRAGA